MEARRQQDDGGGQAPSAGRRQAVALWSRAVAPSRWSLAATAVVLAWRLAALLLRDAFGDAARVDDAPVWALLEGCLWDVVLVHAVFVWAALSRRATAHLTGAGRALRHLAVLWPAALLLAATTARALDAGHCYLGQCHWTAEGFLYFDEGMAGFALNPRVVALAVITLLGGALLVWLAGRDGRRRAAALAAPTGGAAITALALAALVGGAPAALALRDGLADPPPVHSLRLVPEVNMWVQWRVARGGTVCAATASHCVSADASPDLLVDDDTWRLWQRLDLVPPRGASRAPFPLLRFRQKEPPLPYPAAADAVTPPNIVITLMESMSGHFVSKVSGHYRGLTPELDALAGGPMTLVRGYYNTASPTINGLVATLCSLHPSIHPSDVGIGEEVDNEAPFTCISDVLRQRGYRTVFVGAFVKTVTSMEYLARTHGFDEFHGLAEHRKRFPGRAEGRWGMHDDALVDYTLEQLDRLKRQRAEDDRPFLLVMLTLDGHEPGMGGADCQLPRRPDRSFAVADVPDDADSLQQLSSVHCADREVGRLGRHLLADGRRQRTMWLITADHALIRTRRARKVLFDDAFYGGFAPLPLLIHDPGHRLPGVVDVVSGTTDVAPSILHLLGVDRVPTTFTGRSVFGRRASHPFIVGRMGARLVMMAEPGRKSEKPVGRARELCRQGRPWFGGDEPSQLSACQLMRYFDWQDTLWRTRRLLPPSVFAGTRGVDDVRRLEQRQDLNKAERKARLHRRPR